MLQYSWHSSSNKRGKEEGRIIVFTASRKSFCPSLFGLVEVIGNGKNFNERNVQDTNATLMNPPR